MGGFSLKMARGYQTAVPEVGKCAVAKYNHAKVSFKNTYSVVRVMRGMKLAQAKDYAEQVLRRERCVPMVRFNENCGRTAQAKEWGSTSAKGRWPVKRIKFAGKMINKAEANAKDQGLDVDDLCVYQFHVNRTKGRRRRVFGAHGRIKAFNSKPCHIQIVLAPSAHKVREAKGCKQFNALAVHHRIIKVGSGKLANIEPTCSPKEQRLAIKDKVALRRMKHMKGK